jgi:16S rRNA (cytosine967-C5)-methyltransferase
LDVDARRLDELRRRARRAGAHNVRVTPIDTPEATAAAMQRLHGAAERVLVDAPCSGTGTFRRKPDARYRLDAATLAAHAARQRDLLDRYAPLVKPRGRLVYGTCSLLRDENEAVIDDFLRRHPDFALAPPERWLPPDAPIPLTRGGMLRLYPHRHDTDGFFGAVLVREAAPPGKAALP